MAPHLIILNVVLICMFCFSVHHTHIYTQTHTHARSNSSFLIYILYIDMTFHTNVLRIFTYTENTHRLVSADTHVHAHTHTYAYQERRRYVMSIVEMSMSYVFSRTFISRITNMHTSISLYKHMVVCVQYFCVLFSFWVQQQKKIQQ